MAHKQTLTGLFLNRIDKSKNSNCIGWIKDGKLKFLSYKEYADIVESLALYLNSLGLGSGDKVAILAQTRREWHYMDMATLCSGCTVIPIYPSYTSNEVEYIINHSESKLVIVENDEQLEKVLEEKDNLPQIKHILTIDECSEELLGKIPEAWSVSNYTEALKQGQDLLKTQRDHVIDIIKNVEETDVASIIYTSGTTGEPKGAVITHKAFASMLENVQSAIQGAFGPEDRSLTFLPLSHVFGRADSLAHLVMGWETVYAESIDKIVDNLSVASPTLMMAVPRIFEKVYTKIMQQVDSGSPIKKKLFHWAIDASNAYFDKIDKDLAPTSFEIVQRQLAYKLVFSKVYAKFGGKIRFFVSGGAPLSVEIIKFMRNANLPILEGYGLTETVAPCTLNPIIKQIPGTVGTPLGDTKISFAEDGEILVQSGALLTGYYNNPEATAAAIKEGWFHTGDIGELTPEGYLKITDRKKDIIITSGGKNVAPQKIENLMKNRRHIAHFMVIGDQRKYLSAVIGIEKEPFIDYLQDYGISPHCTIEELANHPKIKELIQRDIDVVNEDLASFETIKKFYIAPEEFTVEGGHTTPSLKLRKKFLMNKFQNEIDAMY